MTSTRYLFAFLILSVALSPYEVSAERSRPRNGTIVFEVLNDRVVDPLPDMPLPTDDYDLFTVGPSGADLTRLTSGPDTDGTPAWSPDGRKIAFARAFPYFLSQSDIFVMEDDGGGVTNLTNTPSDVELAPDWSPDGSRIAMTRISDYPTLLDPPGLGQFDDDLFVMDADGENLRPLLEEPGRQVYPAWSPDGQWVVYTDSPSKSLKLILADGSSVKRLTPKNAFSAGWSEGLLPAPSWSPDGKWIAFHTPVRFADIWLIRSDGTDLRRITRGPAGDFYPSWSPDGTMLAFTSDRDGDWGLFTIDVNGGTLRRIVDLDMRIWIKPDWRAHQ